MPLLVAIGCTGVFLALALLVSGAAPPAFDTQASALIQGLPLPVDLWELITAMGGGLLIVVGTSVVLFLLDRRELALALLFAGVLITVTLGVDHIKDLVARPRPGGSEVWAPGYSFPSGHAFLSTVTYGLLAMAAWRSELPIRARQAIVVGTVLLVALIGCSRIALGAHYPIDVLAGWIGGMAVLAGVAAIGRGTRLQPQPA